jgi:hypothetical protein
MLSIPWNTTLAILAAIHPLLCHIFSPVEFFKEQCSQKQETLARDKGKPQVTTTTPCMSQRWKNPKRNPAQLQEDKIN